MARISGASPKKGAAPPAFRWPSVFQDPAQTEARDYAHPGHRASSHNFVGLGADGTVAGGQQAG